MLDRLQDTALLDKTRAGLVDEAVRRLLKKSTYAAADPEMLRALILAETQRGVLTLFGLARAIERV